MLDIANESNRFLRSSQVFAIGDIHGCDFELANLLKLLPKDANIICLGDLVNRGLNSLGVLRRLKKLTLDEGRSQALLGNHDLYFLAYANGLRLTANASFDTILAADDAGDLIDWLRMRPLAIRYKNFLCVHAGILPSWSPQQTMDLAKEVEHHLHGPNYEKFLVQILGDEPSCWNEKLHGIERLRFITNTLTRMRFCAKDGNINLSCKDSVSPSAGYLPWFNQTTRRTQSVTVVFGHWSTMGLINRPSVIGLDTGCVWGGKLSAMSLCNFDKRLLIQANKI